MLDIHKYRNVCRACSYIIFSTTECRDSYRARYEFAQRAFYQRSKQKQHAERLANAELEESASHHCSRCKPRGFTLSCFAQLRAEMAKSGPGDTMISTFFDLDDDFRNSFQQSRAYEDRSPSALITRNLQHRCQRLKLERISEKLR